MVGIVKNFRHGVSTIKSDDDSLHYFYGPRIPLGSEVVFREKENDIEWAEDLKVIPEPLEISIKKSLLAALITFLIVALGLIVAIRVYASPLDDSPVEDVELLARLAHAEAHNQDVDGMRLVVDVVLNRVDSPEFPGTVKEIIYQTGQFSVVDNGTLEKVIPEESDYEAVMQELETRTNREILFFTSGGYGRYGKPAFKYKDHYFST